MTNNEALTILRKRVLCKENAVSCGCLLIDCDECENNVTDEETEKALATAVEALELMVSLEDDKK